ncbi:M23 family metallopeptidase [Spirochaeta africana]|uniref:Metalloendopeptidase-like membrane protein n=1 Tax=Spirochaeta africana (strain ATCC 700263 / DSM 8902 / Z-7692) TaxID=889378 RepID=H9UIH6_SPIAZ|nr:M23 family metallopeptidase [Spirochaeta africana]AFG37319.1 metalloendopeptidase-like membrane protein [Spirochaeta africana DSM 8902]
MAGTLTSGGMNSALGAVEQGFHEGIVNLSAQAMTQAGQFATHLAALSVNNEDGLNSGGLIRQAFDDSGGLSLNLMDISTLMRVGGRFTRGHLDGEAHMQRERWLGALGGIGLNMQITSSGTSGSFGQGSDIGLAAGLLQTYDGLTTRAWAQQEAARYGDEADAFYTSMGLGYSFGDPVLRETMLRLRDGFDTLAFGGLDAQAGGITHGLTTANANGQRTIRIDEIGEAGVLSVMLAHESWRDGRGTGANTLQAVQSQVQMAGQVAGVLGIGAFSSRTDIIETMMNYQNMSSDEFAAYVDERFDSSDDYYRPIVDSDGDMFLEVTGQPAMIDEEGRLLVQPKGGLQGSLQYYVNGGEENLYALMQEHGMEWDGNSWIYDDSDGPIRLPVGNIKDPNLSAALFLAAHKNLVLDDIIEAYTQSGRDIDQVRDMLDDVSRGNIRAVVGNWGNMSPELHTELLYVSRVNELRSALGDHFISTERKLFDEFARLTQGMGPAHESVREFYQFHPAIDYVVGGAGDVYSGMSGKIAQIGLQGGYGNTVVIDHGFEFEGQFFSSGFSTRQSHFADDEFGIYIDVFDQEVSFVPGDWVNSNTRLGLQGNTGNSTNPHVDFQLFHSTQYTTPRFLDMFQLPMTDLNFSGTPSNLYRYDATEWLRQLYGVNIP